MSDNPNPGFFGKLPALGDFVHRHLPNSFIRRWDDWLQAAIANSKAQLGEHWLEVYLHSPIWRFSLSPGVAGEHGWCGAIMPSVDRVGRYFPLTLAAPLEESASTLAVVGVNSWFEPAEALLLQALEEQSFEMDSFTQAVVDLGTCPMTTPSLGAAHDSNSIRTGWQLELGASNSAVQALSQMNERLLLDRFGHFSLWWTSGSNLIKPSLLVCPDLPDAEAFTAMLDGQWAQSSWTSVDAARSERADETVGHEVFADI